MFELICLSLNGSSLTQEMYILLLEEAYKLSRKGEKSQLFHRNFCEGRISTEGQRFTMGFFSGERFTAEIESDEVKTKVSFLVADKVFEVLDEDEFDEFSMGFRARSSSGTRSAYMH